ncbi:hypothetical protein [Methanobrevibacter sp.]|uniref:hypothetical protein n=1 Tax=Methanobrevibacter sp. TaxID=66852 RepID=UPI0025FEEB81|nr:hypothetical protein [Methanobrevibacter sp.]MBQ2832415.1 hypothetical protein [Methanobrevibacter sp.]
MKVLDIEDVSRDAIADTYSTCKYIERQGISIGNVTLGNAHEVIEEVTDNCWLPITQVTNNNVIEGYIIGA